MAIYPSPSLILAPVLALNLGLAVAGYWGQKPGRGAGFGLPIAAALRGALRRSRRYQL